MGYIHFTTPICPVLLELFRGLMKVMASRRENRGGPFFSQPTGPLQQLTQSTFIYMAFQGPPNLWDEPHCPVVPFLALLFLDISMGSPLPFILMNIDYCFSLYFPQRNSEPSLLNWIGLGSQQTVIGRLPCLVGPLGPP